jgi:hypothetical protein
VVIGIIAVLIAVLLPALGKARKQAQTVQCASNLRQLYALTVMYSNLHKGYTMPARTWPGSSQSNFWCGVDVLGPLMGIKRLNTPNAQIEALNRIQKMLDCPASERTLDNAAGIVFFVDYTYNRNLGDDRSIPGSPQYNASYQFSLNFKKRSQVPESVVVAVDAGAQVCKGD